MSNPPSSAEYCLSTSFTTNTKAILKLDPDQVVGSTAELTLPSTTGTIALTTDVGGSSPTFSTYTPTIGDGTINFVHTAQSGHFAEIGGLCFFYARVAWNGKNGITLNPILVSLPKAADASVVEPPVSSHVKQGIIRTINNEPHAFIVEGSSTLSFFHTDSNGNTGLTLVGNDYANIGDISISGWYATNVN